jgi:hypothetical protein
MSDELKKSLKEKHREKDEGSVLIGELNLEEVNARQMPSLEEQAIEPEKQMILHSIVCRAGYQRNIHRTEGVNYRALYDDLASFIIEELSQAGKTIVDSGVQGEEDEEAQPEEDGGLQGPAEETAEAGGDVRDEERGSTGPQLRIPEEQRRKKRS